MKRAARWTLVVILSLSVVAAVLVGAFMRFVPDDRELAARIAAAAEQNLGVKVTVGSAHLQLWPQPELVLTDLATSQAQPIVLKRVVARARLSELLRGRLNFEHAEVDGAVVPLVSLRGLHVNRPRLVPRSRCRWSGCNFAGSPGSRDTARSWSSRVARSSISAGSRARPS